MMIIMITYSVKQLAQLAGISARTLHYYDQIGLLAPHSHSPAGYRLYSEKELLVLQQILFFRELRFNLDEIRQIISRPGFDVVEALISHRAQLLKKIQRMHELIKTVDNTIEQLKGEKFMDIKEYYQGFSDEQIEKHRQEVRQRWGEETLKDSEARVKKMGKDKFAELQTEGNRIFRSIADNMSKGAESPQVQKLVAQWQDWLEHFSHYSDEALLGLGRMYSQHEEFAAFYRKIHPGLPEFFTKAIEYYVSKTTNER